QTLLFRSRDATVALTGLDPTADGATLEITNSHAGLEQAETLPMPASGWSGVGTPIKSYRYRDRTLANGPVKSATVRGGKLLKVSARNTNGTLTFALAGSPQLGLDVVVTSGPVRFCAGFGGTLKKDDGSHFLAVDAPAPAACAGGTTTTTTT